MTEETKAAEAQVESLRVARGKLAKVIEIYAPIGITRENALSMMGLALIEFEAAVREDERAKSGDAQNVVVSATPMFEGQSPEPPVAPSAPEVADVAAPASRKRK